jgi:cytidine deaminase
VEVLRYIRLNKLLPARCVAVNGYDAHMLQTIIPAAEARQADLASLLPRAAQLARPPISNYFVGAIARGLSGALYLGANIEVAGEALSFTTHAEQSAVTHAWMNGEEGIDLIAVTAPPCGYCRQFLNELSTADRLTISIPGATHTLRELLPSSFGPRDLGVEGGLLQRDDHGLVIDEDDELAQMALVAANRSYAPYSKSYAGVAVRASNGAWAAGAYAENAAFNPSMAPLEVALSELNLRGGAFDDITDAVLVHVDGLHTNATRLVLAAVTGAPLRTISARGAR